MVTLDDDGGYIAECEELKLFTCAETLDELREMVAHMLNGHFHARRQQGTLNELIAKLRGASVPEPTPSVKLISDFSFRDIHSLQLN